MADAWTKKRLQWLDRVMYDPRFTAAEHLAVYDIASRLNRATGDCWVRQATTAKSMQISIPTVKRAVAKLVKFQYATVRFDGHQLANRLRPLFRAMDQQRSIGGITSDPSVGSPVIPNIPSIENPLRHPLQRRALDNASSRASGSAEGQQERKRAAVPNALEGERYMQSTLGEVAYDKLTKLNDQEPLLRLFRVYERQGGRLTAQDIEAARAAVRSVT